MPSLDLRFAETKSLTDAISGQNLITFTRASSATVINAAGALETVASNVPRFDHNPLTGECLGLLVEEARTNLLLNSATLSTQNVTVSAAAHTLSFTGTGTITLSGTSTAGPLVGTGTGEASRVSLTFTPTAGTLTLTVSGTVSNAQLELGGFRTSYIPTTTATATRSADVASITGANFSSWYRQDEGTVFASSFALKNASGVVWGVGDTFSNVIYMAATTANNFFVISADTLHVALSASVSSSTTSNTCVAYKVNDFAAVSGGGAVSTDTSGAVPVSPIRLKLGSSAWDESGTNVPCGHIRRFAYWPQRLPDTTLQSLTR